MSDDTGAEAVARLKDELSEKHAEVLRLTGAELRARKQLEEARGLLDQFALELQWVAGTMAVTDTERAYSGTRAWMAMAEAKIRAFLATPPAPAVEGPPTHAFDPVCPHDKSRLTFVLADAYHDGSTLACEQCGRRWRDERTLVEIRAAGAQGTAEFVRLVEVRPLDPGRERYRRDPQRGYRDEITPEQLAELQAAADAVNDALADAEQPERNSMDSPEAERDRLRDEASERGSACEKLGRLIDAGKGLGAVVSRPAPPEAAPALPPTTPAPYLGRSRHAFVREHGNALCHRAQRMGIFDCLLPASDPCHAPTAKPEETPAFVRDVHPRTGETRYIRPLAPSEGRGPSKTIYINERPHQVTWTHATSVALLALSGRDATYQCFLEGDPHGSDTLVTHWQHVEIKDGQRFYCVPAATMSSEGRGVVTRGEDAALISECAEGLACAEHLLRRHAPQDDLSVRMVQAAIVTAREKCSRRLFPPVPTPERAPARMRQIIEAIPGAMEELRNLPAPDPVAAPAKDDECSDADGWCNTHDQRMRECHPPEPPAIHTNTGCFGRGSIEPDYAAPPAQPKPTEEG